MSAKQYRKKPVVIEAIQFDGRDETSKAINEWAGKDVAIVDTDHIEHLWDFDAGCYILPSGKMIHAPFTVRHLIIMTLEGDMLARAGWWVIKGVQGEFYPCDPDIFSKTYEAAD
jgi:hypothetical protein